MIAMLLAAGRGERLRPLTETVPKALVEVGGVPLIERHLHALAQAGVDTAVINLGWLGARLQDHLGGGERFGVQIIYSDEGDEILETGGGIVRALPFLGNDPFLVVNADIVTDIDFASLALPDDADVHLVLVPRPADRERGDFGIDKGRLSNASPELVFSGVSLYRPAFFKACRVERFSVAPMLRQAANEGRASAHCYAGYWADVGTPARLEAANARLA
ncbi:MAG: N-acetylmuramate alpha-1-phosphate uridylyltransferase MurU [Pseudomonadota bacterium]